MFSLTPVNKVCFDEIPQNCKIHFAQQYVTTYLVWFCGDCLQNSFTIKYVFTIIVITSYSLQKCDIILLGLNFGI